MSKQSKSALEPKKVSGELFTLTYGAFVAQLIKDYEDSEEVNQQLDKMGYDMGLRLIDDFLAKNPHVGKCTDLKDVAEVLAKQGFRNYLGIVPVITNWSLAGDEFSLILEYNPLAEFVEFPPNQDCSKLWYSQVLCGAIRGALEMVHMEAECWFVQDQLKEDPQTELRIKFIRRLEETVPAGED